MKRRFPLDLCLRITLGALVVAIVGDLTATLLFSGNHDSSNVYAARRIPDRGNDAKGSSAEAFFAPVSLELDGIQLIDFLDRYSELYGFTFFLDRRVDPTTSVSCSVSNIPLIDALNAVFTSSHLSFCVVDGALLYVGPEDAAAELQLLFQIKRSELESGAIPTSFATKLERSVDFQISPFAEPHDVFQALARLAQIKLIEFENLPFDRWRGVRISNVYVGNLLTVLAIGFNAEYQYDPKANAVKPTPIDRDRTETLIYDAELTSQLSRSRFHACSFQDVGNKTMITGKFADLVEVEVEAAKARRVFYENAARANAPNIGAETQENDTPSRASSRGGKTLISGSVVNKTLRDLFAYLEKSANVRCQLDPSLQAKGVSLDTRITCDFKNADVRKVGTTIASQIGARAQIDGNTITFTKK